MIRMERCVALRSAYAAFALIVSANVAALECPKLPEQAGKDWEVEVRAAVGKIGPAKGTELQTLTRNATRDLMGKLPKADKVYLEQMMYATYCSGLRDDSTLSDSQKSARIRAYNTEVRNTLSVVAAKGVADEAAKQAALQQLKRIPLPFTPEAFVDSARKGNLAAVRLFIATGMDLDIKDERSYEPAISAAASEGHLSIVQLLLKGGASDGRALERAAEKGHREIVSFLLNRGASSEKIYDAFLAAAGGGQLESLLLLKRGADRSWANEALKMAAGGMRDVNQEERNEVIGFLLALGANVNAKNNRGGWPALHIAAQAGIVPNVQALLDAGADPNMTCGCTYTISYNSESLLSDHDPLTPLMLVAVADRIEDTERARVMELLLVRGANPNFASTNGTTALMFAAYHWDAPASVRVLLDHGANANSQNSAGQTALLFALSYASYPSVDVVKALLAHGINVNVTDSKGVSALMLSVGEAEVFRVLLKSGADVNARDKKNGSTALLWAASHRVAHITTLLKAEAGNVVGVEALLDAGAGIHAKNKFGQSALMLAVREGNPNVVRVLLKRGAKADDRDEDGKSVLNYAEEDLEGKERVDMIRILKKAGAKK